MISRFPDPKSYVAVQPLREGDLLSLVGAVPDGLNSEQMVVYVAKARASAEHVRDVDFDDWLIRAKTKFGAVIRPMFGDDRAGRPELIAIVVEVNDGTQKHTLRDVVDVVMLFHATIPWRILMAWRIKLVRTRARTLRLRALLAKAGA